MARVQLDEVSRSIGIKAIENFKSPRKKRESQCIESNDFVIFPSFIPKLNDNQLDKFTKAVAKINKT